MEDKTFEQQEKSYKTVSTWTEGGYDWVLQYVPNTREEQDSFDA